MLLDQVRRRELARSVPERCGVYLFRGPQDAPLYIGKAVNLRRRVQQHLRAERAESARRGSLLRRFERIDWIPCPTELHALLLEDELIKRHLPPGNRRQKQYLRNRFLAFGEGPFPALRLLEREEVAGERELFGPFRSEWAARRLLEIAHRPLNPFARPALTLGRPPAACADPAAWAEAVRRTRAFLLGEAAELLEELAGRMARLSRERRFEEAARARDQLLEVRRFCLRQRFFQSFRARPLLLQDRGRWAGSYLFLDGRLAYYTPELLGRRRGRQIGERLLAGRAAAHPAPQTVPAIPRAAPPRCPGSHLAPPVLSTPRAPLPVEVLWDRALVLSAWRRRDPQRRILRFLDGPA